MAWAHPFCVEFERAIFRYSGVKTVSVIVSTYNQPQLLRRCLVALGQQSCKDYELLIADDGSGDETRALIERHARSCEQPVKHIWHEDEGFRKTVILNESVLAASGDYLIFIDGDCIAHPEFIGEHVRQARPGHYLNGSLIRLGEDLSDRITETAIRDGLAFEPAWLMRQGQGFNRRYLRLALSYGLRQKLDRHTRTKLYWLGSNSSCFKADAVSVNGFDHRFTYGFEDADFGYRLELSGLTPRTVRWTAVLFHLWHRRPWSNPRVLAENRKRADETLASGRTRAVIGIEELPGQSDNRSIPARQPRGSSPHISPRTRN
jgi:glycosyltransferase involved in cell wall biosynthesis